MAEARLRDEIRSWYKQNAKTEESSDDLEALEFLSLKELQGIKEYIDDSHAM